MRPDLVLQRNDHIIVIELTCCFKANLVHSKKFKMKNTKVLKDIAKLQSTKLELFLSKCHHSVLLQKRLNAQKKFF